MTTRNPYPRRRLSREPETSLETATRLIVAAQRDIGRTLTGGERRDLLKDNTPWTPATIAAIVAILARRKVQS